jgi:hypothetical protein
MSGGGRRPRGSAGEIGMSWGGRRPPVQGAWQIDVQEQIALAGGAKPWLCPSCAWRAGIIRPQAARMRGRDRDVRGRPQAAMMRRRDRDVRGPPQAARKRK